jgi:hypothetical protein
MKAITVRDLNKPGTRSGVFGMLQAVLNIIQGNRNISAKDSGQNSIEIN